MKLFDVYGWAIGPKSEFTKPFRDNEELLEKANSFWKEVESYTLCYILTFVIIGIVLALVYYTYYNNKPGRHYHPKYWLMFGCFSLVFSFVATWLCQLLLLGTEIQGAVRLELTISSVNVLYVALLYLVMSVICCNTLSTNAYKIFKI